MNNISWIHYPSKFVSIDEYNSMITNCISIGLTRISTEGKREITAVNKLRGHYFISDAMVPGAAQYQVILYIAHPQYGYMKYCVPMSKAIKGENDIEEKKNYGYYGWQFINDRFKDEYGIRLETAYSGPQFKEIFWKIKKCVCSPINYVTSRHTLLNVVLSSCYKSDESSSYPAKLLGLLPTLHGYKQVEGRQEPTKEYPFAFYTKSGHMKIYNELDSRNFNNEFYLSYNDPESRWKHDDLLAEEQDETILCRACHYNMEPIINKIYLGRKAHPEYKDYMNMCIGYFHTTNPTTGPVCAHIAAVVMARCINLMCKRAARIKNEGNTILLINTDAIAWLGNQSTISETTKKLGAFVTEYENCKMIISGVKKYQIEANGNVITVCAGMPKEKSRAMKFGDLLNEEVELECYIVDKLGYLVRKIKNI